MKFEEIKAIAAARTKGEWKPRKSCKEAYAHAIGPDHPYEPESDVDEFELAERDAAFIAMAANNIDKLITIAEAAKDVELEEHKEDGKIEPKLSHLYYALAALESDK